MIEVEKSSGIARITLARPEVRNALSGELMGALGEALADIESDDQVRAVVLTGQGKAFSAGADLSAMRKVGSTGTDANRTDALEMGRLFHRIAGFSKPTVARVNGPAIGGGVGLMAACDVVVAADSAFFAFSEVRLGLVPAVISPFCIRRLGAARAKRLFLTGQKIDAVTAERFGLVDEVVDAGRLDEAVDAITVAILAGGPEALKTVKELVDTVAATTVDDALAYTADLIAGLRASSEAQEGMTAFLEKRRPSWVKSD